MTSECPRPRRRVKHPDSHRNSNVVRASVLETALELGFGQNSTVADWIFNNPLSEQVEECHSESNESDFQTNSEPTTEVANASTPTFTSGSNSISDESSSLNSPGNIARSAAITAIQVHTHKPSITEPPHVHFGDFSLDQLQLFSPCALSTHDVHRVGVKGNLLEKHPGDNERPHSQGGKNPNRENPSPAPPDAGYTSEGQYLSKGRTGKAKGKPGKFKGNKKVLDNSKTNDKDGDCTSDGGYLSASSNKSLGKSPGRVKSRAMSFFRRRSKKPASEDEDDDMVPPVPALPTVPRPSSPKLLERRTAPSSPARPGFSPLTLNLTSPPASPPRRHVSSPPSVSAKASPRSNRVSTPQRPASPLVSSTSPPVALTPVTIAATVPLPPSLPGTPLSTTSFPTSSTTLFGVGGPPPKSLTLQSSRQHLNIPPPAPPPTLPLPQLPPSPPISSIGVLPSFPLTPTIPSRRPAPTRPVPVVPPSPGSVQPLTPRRTASPLRPIISPRTLSSSVPRTRNGELASGVEGDQSNPNIGRKRSGTGLSTGLGSTPAFLQRKIQHGSPPTLRHSPCDIHPSLSPNTHPRTPIGSPSKFHEHFSSVSSVPLSQILSTPVSMSPSPSIATLSGSSSGPSVRSSHLSSVSGRSEEPVAEDPLNQMEYTCPATSMSIMEGNCGQPIIPAFHRPGLHHQSSQFSGRSDIGSSVYSPTHQDNCSITTYDGDEADVDDITPRSRVAEDDDASVYTSDDKTAGRRTMYLVEHGEPDEKEEVVVTGSRYYDVPPLPPLPSMPTRPGPGYF